MPVRTFSATAPRSRRRWPSDSAWPSIRSSTGPRRPWARGFASRRASCTWRSRLEALAAVRSALEAYDDPAALAALSAATTLTGSALLALAVARGFLTPAEAWAAAHVDEDFQSELWGADEEAAARRAARWREMEAAAAALEATAAV